MNRLDGFINSFINIVLSLIVTLIFSWMFFAKAASLEGSKSIENWFFMACLGVFVIKYLHEYSVSSHRFPLIQTKKSSHGGWPFGLFFSKFGVPITLCFIIGLFIFNLIPNTLIFVLLSTTALFFHIFLYMIPDIYIRKIYIPRLLKKRRNFPWKDVPERWLKIDKGVIIGIFLCIILLLILFISKGLQTQMTWVPKFVKYCVGGIFLVQSIVDWIWNKSFFFG